MHTEGRRNVYRRALVAVKAGRVAEATELLRGLVDEGSKDPRHLSLLGLMLATSGPDRVAGLKLCQRATIIGVYEAELYLNLAKAHARLGQPAEAVQVLRRGLRLSPVHSGLRAEIERLSPRRGPVVGLLPREHFINRYLGRALRRTAS